jgi:RNA polymerase sigma factor (sigma-70 family)
MSDQAIRGSEPSGSRPRPLLALFPSLRKSLYEQSGAAEWGLSPEQFDAVLELSAAKTFAQSSPDPRKLEQFLSALHLHDLALAAACAHGCEAAWDRFVAVYRPYLRASAAAILRSPPDSPEASDLADSLFSDLYGITETSGPTRSLFRYFHGRSSLNTWLRAVLAQRHIDAIRSARRFVPIDSEAQSEHPVPQLVSDAPPADPHRERYLALFRRALETAVAGLDRRDSERLRSYYLEDRTLAAIGRALGEHESSVSRNLDRIRRLLRRQVEALLRAGFSLANGSAATPGLSDPEITLCFQYAAEDAPINLNALLAPFPATSAEPVHSRKIPAAGAAETENLDS